MGWGGRFKRRPQSLLGAEWHPDLQMGEDMLGTKSRSGGGQYPCGGAPPNPAAPLSLCNLGKVVPQRRSPAVPVPGSCRRRHRRKVCGAGGGHGATWRGAGGRGAARGAQGMLLGMLPRMLGGGRGALPRIHGGCCPGCSEDAARDARMTLPRMLGRCLPGCSGDAREVLAGMMRVVLGGCSRVARAMLGKCSPG